MESIGSENIQVKKVKPIMQHIKRCPLCGEPGIISKTYRVIDYKPSESATIRILFGVECFDCGNVGPRIARDFIIPVPKLDDEAKYKESVSFAVKLWNDSVVVEKVVLKKND